MISIFLEFDTFISHVVMTLHLINGGGEEEYKISIQEIIK